MGFRVETLWGDGFHGDLIVALGTFHILST